MSLIHVCEKCFKKMKIPMISITIGSNWTCPVCKKDGATVLIDSCKALNKLLYDED